MTLLLCTASKEPNAGAQNMPTTMSQIVVVLNVMFPSKWRTRLLRMSTMDEVDDESLRNA